MADAAITMYGAEWCGDCRRSKRLLDSLGVAYEYIDVANDDAGKDVAIEICGKQSIPVITFSDGTFVVEPSDIDLRAKIEALGLL
jgi:glutaredoxin-like protein